ncbi:hypothetical protein GCM10028803_40840 [Larkinella knui]|uniref:DUF2911 domain-containing protein n=1 Tax=Larkinella knui TaxID=2025310 RepID=A0A3P1CNC9_9BACT|nr:DUF2911 domain-containing protein [Larkinella knui]RRB14718.1 DUF2911 domain-containing protein [Larkinella knui]
MKKGLLVIIALLVTATSTLVFAQAKSPHLKVESPGKSVKVVYGQPSKRGRVIFGANGLEKYGTVWRTGADEATEITFAKDVMFGDKMVKAGTYTLFTIPDEKEWTVILNSKLGQWGAYDYIDPVKGAELKKKDVAQIKVPAKTNATPVEKLTITPTESEVSIAWDVASISIPIKPVGGTN